MSADHDKRTIEALRTAMKERIKERDAFQALSLTQEATIERLKKEIARLKGKA